MAHRDTAESQDRGKMSQGSTCEKEEKSRNLIVYTLNTEQSSQALGFSFAEWLDEFYCACLRGE